MGITKIQILLINLFCLVFVWVVIYGNSNSYATFEKKTKIHLNPEFKISYPFSIRKEIKTIENNRPKIKILFSDFIF